MPDLALGPAVRTLTAEQLNIGFAAAAITGKAASAPDAPEIDVDDPDVRRVIGLLGTYSGVLLTGPPGTSKTYLAHKVAAVMAEGDDTRYAFTQFHPSYQYEDFMEGYRPDEIGGGFQPKSGVFLKLCEDALKKPDLKYVLVIDELSRGDAARVFGEALTYVEKSKRGMKFALPSGRPGIIPPNVHIIATMNPLDRGVDEVDAAFERRFAKLTMAPDVELLESRLVVNGLSDELRAGVLGWFRDINGQSNPAAQIGHAYFWDVTDEKSLKSAWEYQIRYHVDRAFRYEDKTRERLHKKWEAMYTDAETAAV